MHLFKICISRALLLAMLGGAGPALAAPVYHVLINTASLAGQSGYLDFLFLGLGNAAPARISLSNFSGDFTSPLTFTGDVSGSPATGTSLGNGTGWNELAQWTRFGASLQFDLSADTVTGTGAGSTLSIALLDSQFGYVGYDGDLMTVALQPGQADSVTLNSGLVTASISAVPEPDSWLMLATGMAVLWWATRPALRHRRQSSRCSLILIS